MEQSLLTKREFLKKTAQYAAGTAVGLAGISAISGNKLFAEPTAATWPFPYVKLDSKDVMKRAHKLYYADKDCGSGTFGAIVNALQEQIGEPWTNIPIEILLYGRGGGAGWGTLCGTLNGGAALISMVTPKLDSTALINELWGWYTQEPLPSTNSNQMAIAGEFESHKFDGDLPQSISSSPLCHTSVSLWAHAANKKVGDIERKERCGRICADVAGKTVEILNAWYDKTFQQTWAVPESNKGCLSWHGVSAFYDVMANMTCEQCHGADPHGTGSVKSISSDASDVIIHQNFPNPFMGSTNIKFEVNASGKTKLEIYDIQGYLVSTILDNGILERGTYETNWAGTDDNGNRVNAGIYFARLTFANTQKLIKMQVLR